METTARSTWRTPAAVADAFGLPFLAPETVLFAEHTAVGAHGASARVLLATDGLLSAVAAWQAPGASLHGQWRPYRTSPAEVRRDWLDDPARRAVLEPLLAAWSAAVHLPPPLPIPSASASHWHVSPVPGAVVPQAFAWRGPDDPVAPPEILVQRPGGRPRLWNGATAADACFRAVEDLAAAGHPAVPIVPCPGTARLFDEPRGHLVRVPTAGL